MYQFEVDLNQQITNLQKKFQLNKNRKFFYESYYYSKFFKKPHLYKKIYQNKIVYDLCYLFFL